MLDSTQNRWARAAVVALLFVLTGEFGHLLAIPPGLATPVWLPSGIALAVVMLWGRHVWPGVFVGSTLVSWVQIGASGPVLETLLATVTVVMISIGVTAEPLLAAYLFRRLRRQGRLLCCARNLAMFLLVAVPIGCALSASIGSLSLLSAGLVESSRMGETWATWFIGDVSGIYVITPPLLIWAEGNPAELSAKDRTTAIGSVLALAAVCAFAFFDIVLGRAPHPALAFLPIPLLVFIAYRFGDRFAGLVGTAVAACAILAAVVGQGPFRGEDPHEALLSVQLFTLVGILTALFTRALANERDAAETEAHRLSADLARVSRVTMMGEIAAGVAHEYHQPLAAISNYASACLNKLRPHDSAYREVHGSLERIIDEAHRAAKIVDRLKDFLQKREPSRVVCDPNELVLDAVGLTRTAHLFPGTFLSYEPTPNLPLVKVDRVQITQILVNLILNSCEAIAGSDIVRGEVHVSTHCANTDRIRICVEDNGPGMGEGIAQACFDHFYSTKEHGMGIGLGISKTLAEAHGGRLFFEPPEEGGARFCLELRIRG